MDFVQMDRVRHGNNEMTDVQIKEECRGYVLMEGKHYDGVPATREACEVAASFSYFFSSALAAVTIS